METMTSAFPSSTPSHNNVQLDNIIFYSGPSSVKTREITPIDVDEWPDIDTVFAGAAQHKRMAATSGGFDITSEDIPDAIDTSSEVQMAISTLAHPEHVSTPRCNSLDDMCGGVAGGGESAKSQEQLGVWSTKGESVPAETSGTVQLDVQHNSRDSSVIGHDCPLNDVASLALWEAFRDDGWISAPVTDNPTFLPQPANTDRLKLDLPMQTQVLSPGCPEIDIAPSDKSSLEEWDQVQQPPLSDDRECNSACPIMLESSPVEQEDTPKVACDVSTNTAPSDGSTYDRVHSSHDAGATDTAEIGSSDSDGLPSRPLRRRTRPCTRRFISLSPPLTPQSSTHSIVEKSTTALHRRKRLRRRKGVRCDPPAPETDDSSTNSTTSMSSRGGDRWSIQCFIERKMIGSQEMISIQMPSFDLCARSGRITLLSPLDDTSQTKPNLGATSRSRHGARFSRAEEDLLVELKERSEPKLSWRDIHRHFPQRTIGSLQVHYSTHLKDRRTSKQWTCRRS